MNTTEMTSKLQGCIDFFGYSNLTIDIVPRHDRKQKKSLTLLADFITEILGEYCFNTVRNYCPVTVREAMLKKYLFNEQGRLKEMDTESLFEFTVAMNPNLIGDLEAIGEERKKMLLSDKLYPFYKLDKVDMNVYRRMKRGGVLRFLNSNISAFQKSKNKHLQGEEAETRRNLLNTFILLKKLWMENLIPSLRYTDPLIDNGELISRENT